MLYVPAGAGTSGHLLGGALAAILLGPRLAIVVLAIVIGAQGLLFADGGISALGLNILNMAVVTTLGGWVSFRLLMRILHKTTAAALVATMLSAWVSVVLSSLAFVGEYGLGGQGGAPIGIVLGAMVGVHALIGVGEGLITAVVVGAVLAVRPDLVTGISDLGLAKNARAPQGKAVAAFVVGGVLAALALVTIVAPHASTSPDGLERVAIDTGFVAAGSPNAGLGTILAGVVGTLVTFGAGFGLSAFIRRRHPA
jgi:cobalt/nickel transport system permease protein